MFVLFLSKSYPLVKTYFLQIYLSSIHPTVLATLKGGIGHAFFTRLPSI